MSSRWTASTLIWTALRIGTYPGGEPVKGLHKIVLACLIERCDPADGRDGRGRVRNRELAAAAAEVGLSDAALRGATLTGLPALARQSGVAEKVAREAVHAFKLAKWVEAYPRAGRVDLLVLVDDELFAADPRTAVEAETAPVAERTPVADLPPVANAEPVADLPPHPSQICHHTGSESETTPFDYNTRGIVPSRPSLTLISPQGGPPSDGDSGPAAPAAATFDVAAFDRLSALWGQWFETRGRRGRGVFGVNGAEAETLRRLLMDHAETDIAEAVRREILRAANDPRGPRLDWVEDVLKGAARPNSNRPDSRPPQGRGRAGNNVPGATKWSSPAARGEPTT